MNSLRKWFYRPRRDDTSLLAQFYYADEELNLVARELDSFDGSKDQERCTSLVNQLRQCQDRVLNICIEMIEELLPEERASRDFRVKFPDDVMQDTLSGQLWFGAECISAGSSILNRESESTKMRPLAKAVTKTIENVRNLLREQCLKPIPEYTEKIRESLKIFDRLFSDFELSYVSAMVPVKTVEEHDMQQNVIVLFSDTLQRASKLGLVNQDQIDNYDPALMFTIPRLAIVAGLVIFADGPLNLERDSKNLSELFRPFKILLHKIRELLCTMTAQELATLEKCLCSMEEPEINIQSLKDQQTVSSEMYGPVAYTSEFIQKFYANYPSCRQLTPELTSLCSSTKKTERSDRKRDRQGKSSRTRARQERQSERFLSRLTGVEERPRTRRKSRRGNPTSQYYYHGAPDQLQDYWYQNGARRSTRRPIPIPPNPNAVRQDYYSESRHPPPPPPYNSSRHHRPQRQSVRASRHRRDRINTITCAYGSSSYHIPEGYYTYTEDQQVNYCNDIRVNSHYRGANYVPGNDYREHCPYDRRIQEQQQQYNENLAYQAENVSDSTGVAINIQPSIQDIVLNAISNTSDLVATGLIPHSSLNEPNFVNEHQRTDLGSLEKVLTPISPPAPTSINSSMGNCDNICDKGESSEPQEECMGDSTLTHRQESDSNCDNYHNDTREKSLYNHSNYDPSTDDSHIQEHKQGQCDENSDYQSLNKKDFESVKVNIQSSIRDDSAANCEIGETGSRSRNSLEIPNFDNNHSQNAGLDSLSHPAPTSRDLLMGNCDNICDKGESSEPLEECVDDFSSKSLENDSKCDNCSCDSQELSELPSDDTLIPPVPSVRSIHTSFRPYARLHSSDPPTQSQVDSLALEKREISVADSLETASTDLELRSEDSTANIEPKTADTVSSGSTSPHQSGAEDDEELALALQAAEVAVSLTARERFSDPGDLIQRLFVCISGVADQLQTNYASDLRKILRSVFLMNQTPESEPEEPVEILEGKEHYPYNRDNGAEDVTSSNGSEQLSVESAEDALFGIGTPDESERVDFDEESLNHSESLDEDSSPVLTSSVVVPPSVFTDHSLMQYSAMSPPPLSLDHTYSSLTIPHQASDDNDSASNEASSSSEVSSSVTVQPDSSMNLDLSQLSISNSSVLPISTEHSSSSNLPGVSDYSSSNADSRRQAIVQEPPGWIPDHLAPRCMACGTSFNVVRRRHHCRNCGKVFCGHCSRHSVPLPHFGIWKKVRVCNACFLYYVTSSADGSSALS